eukprot:68850-Amphidinium_carterae.1
MDSVQLTMPQAQAICHGCWFSVSRLFATCRGYLRRHYAPIRATGRRGGAVKRHCCTKSLLSVFGRVSRCRKAKDQCEDLPD